MWGNLGVCARAFSPLEGFMSEQQYLSVVQNMRLPVSTALLTLAAMLEAYNHLCGLMGHILYCDTCY